MSMLGVPPKMFLDFEMLNIAMEWGRRASDRTREGFLREGMARAWIMKNELDFMVCKRRHPSLVQTPRERR